MMTGSTYTNPVFPGYMADPFVIQHEGLYFAYGTGPADADGREFPLLRSHDLVTWEPLGGALLPAQAGCHWAPAVAWDGERFYLYYSAGGCDGVGHRLRAAVSDFPTGPFEDVGVELVPDQPFTIDAHPFQDADGQWYLYHCRDFFDADEDQRVGTGIVVDRMTSMTALAGTPQTVVRPFADWHLFQARRSLYGSVYDWHTIEGAATVRHGGTVYCFYSGGAWEQANYGVSYVTAPHPLGPYTRPPSTEPLLRTVPGRVIGPGHNSFTTAPDGSQVIVYHAWDADRTARRMCIDRLTWHEAQPILHAPTDMPQPAFVPAERPSYEPRQP